MRNTRKRAYSQHLIQHTAKVEIAEKQATVKLGRHEAVNADLGYIPMHKKNISFFVFAIRREKLQYEQIL